MSERLYNSANKLVIDDREALLRALSGGVGPFYVYVLCVPPVAQRMRPFYVGVGRSDRIFSHEDEARHEASTGRKVGEIRRIWDSNGQVIHVIDGFYEEEPWEREEALINYFGLVKDGTGILMNEQRYSPSHVQDGVELRKYANDGNNLPDNFNRRDTRLKVGARFPKNDSSVYGKICSVLGRQPGITGEELVELLLKVDFSDNKSAYTKRGAVSRPWLAKYIDGGFYAKNRYIQEEEEP